jgi:hypothetical protein
MCLCAGERNRSEAGRDHDGRPLSAKNFDNYRSLGADKESLSLRPDQREKQRGLRSPFLWWMVVTAAVLYFYFGYG